MHLAKKAVHCDVLGDVEGRDILCCVGPEPALEADLVVDHASEAAQAVGMARRQNK